MPDGKSYLTVFINNSFSTKAAGNKELNLLDGNKLETTFKVALLKPPAGKLDGQRQNPSSIQKNGITLESALPNKLAARDGTPAQT
jgi:hypothetical protein